MAVIEGATTGAYRMSGAPGAGTNEVQTLTIDATGGTFKLAFGGFTTGAISWNATNATLLANINTALQGSAEVQTLTFPATPSGTFRLRLAGQTTAAITWSATNNTLVSNIDTALEALSNIGTSGVVTAVGTMTAGVGTITVTFAAFGTQLPLEVTDNRTGVEITVARTTPGTGGLPNIGTAGVVATAGTLTAGVGTILLTFSGANLAKRVQPTITVPNNSLTGTATAAIVETTPGVDAAFIGALPGALVTDTSNGKVYVNTGTAAAPSYTVIGSVT
jgi:hypothetical protein